MRSPKTGAWTLVRLFPKALVSIAVLLTGTPTSQALPGLSPIWEKLYNNNQPFDPGNPALSPTADPDGDGWTNEQESAAGTHPFDANPPQGIIRPAITAHPDSQNTFTLSWPTHIGKRYRLFVSSTLAAGSWTLCADPMTGTGEDIALLISAINEDSTTPEKQFWRIVIDDIPSTIPGDSHNQWEQEILASHPDITPNTDPPTPEPDDDQDGIPNSKDAAKSDSKITWQAAPEPRYLWLPINSGGLTAVDVNDKGQVLFSCLPPEDFATQPVGKIWDPSKSADKQWSEIFFQPSNFSIRMQKHSKQGQASIVSVAVDPTLEDIVSEDGYGPARSTGTYVQLHAIGDDGSVMAQVIHSHTESYDIEQPQQGSPDSAYVFIWGPGSSRSCHLLGTSRGYGVDEKSWTYNIALGFYTDYKANPPTVRAFMFDQEHTQNPSDDYRNLYFKSYKTTGDLDEKTTLASSGHQQTSDTLYNIQSITPKGSVIVIKLGPDRTLADLTFMVANPQGGTATFPYREDFDSLTEMPGDPDQSTMWALGSATSPFLLHQGEEIVPTQTTGILQLDSQGIGIGSGATGPQPPVIAARGSGTPDTSASGGSSKRDIWINGEFIDFAQATGEPDFPSQLVPKKITASGIIWAGDAGRSNNGILVQARIVPDDNMAGVVGDTIKSILPDSKVDHFVTPRRTDEINQDYVELKAAGMDAETFNRFYTWEGGESGTSAEKRKVNRNTAGLTELKLKTKDGAIAAQTNVWVVWTTLVATKASGPTLSPVTVATPNGRGAGSSIRSKWDFQATIDPPSIVTAFERPDLTGAPRTDVPNQNAVHVIRGGFARPDFKWDISRQMRCRIIAPQIGTNDMADIKAQYGGTLYDNLPNSNIIQPCSPKSGADSYPADPVEGNDDSGTVMENCDVYGEIAGIVGKMTDEDLPELPVVIHKSPPRGAEIEFKVQFKEFCRLEIGKKWFRISDHIPWRHHGKLKKTWILAEDDSDGNGVANADEGKLRDAGSISDTTNNDW